MKKTILLIAALFLMVITFTACNDDSMDELTIDLQEIKNNDDFQYSDKYADGGRKTSEKKDPQDEKAKQRAIEKVWGSNQ